MDARLVPPWPGASLSQPASLSQTPPTHAAAAPHLLPLPLSSAHLPTPWCARLDGAHLRFAAARIDPAHPCLAALHIGGITADRLLAVQVLDDAGAVLEIATMTDMVGRSVSAGEIAQALCHQPHRDCVTLDGAMFLRPVRLALAVVELRVRIADAPDIPAITVNGELAAAGC